MKNNELNGQPNRIEKSTVITGDIVSEADFRIDGTLEGSIKESSHWKRRNYKWDYCLHICRYRGKI